MGGMVQKHHLIGCRLHFTGRFGSYTNYEVLKIEVRGVVWKVLAHGSNPIYDHQLSNFLRSGRTSLKFEITPFICKLEDRVSFSRFPTLL